MRSADVETDHPDQLESIMADESKKKPGPAAKRPPVRDTLTVPGQRGSRTTGGMKKAQPGPIQKPGRRRP